jgi:hypothetical protein
MKCIGRRADGLMKARFFDADYRKLMDLDELLSTLKGVR